MISIYVTTPDRSSENMRRFLVTWMFSGRSLAVLVGAIRLVICM